MKKQLLSLSLSLLWLASCNPTPNTQPEPSPQPTATPTPAPTSDPGAFQGETTLTGRVDLPTNAVMVEGTNSTGTYRQSARVSNQNYTLSKVPVGQRVRLQAQYQNNTFVLLSALVDTSVDQKDQQTTVDINLESTVTDLIYQRAAAQNLSTIVQTPVAEFNANASLNTYRQEILQVLQEIFATQIDAILVLVPEAPRLTETIDRLLPAIDAVLKNQPAPPSATPSPTPGTDPTPAPTATPGSGVFTPTRLLVKPGEKLTIAKDTDLKLWVAGLNDSGEQQTLSNVTWTQTGGSNIGSISSNGTFSPSTAGTATYTVNFGSLSRTVEITVTDAELSTLEMIPDSNFTLNVGQRFELQAKGLDELGNTVTVTPNWELSNTFVAQVDANGVFVPLQPGVVDLTARVGSLSSTITITAESSSAFFIEVAPNNPRVLTGKSQAIQVLGLDTGSNLSSTAFTFSVQNSNIGTFASQDTSINGFTPTAVFRANAPGTTQVTVRDVISNQTTTFPITVENGIPHIESVSPANASLVPGQSITLSGENFSSNIADNLVLFNSIPGQIISASNNVIVATVPVGTFTGFVSVTTNGVKGNAYPFVVTPQISNLIPVSANEGDLITITGQHFSTDNPAHNAVFFGSERASVPINVTNSSLQVRVPNNLSSEEQVSVRVKGQISNFRTFELAGASLPTWNERRAAPSSRAGAHAVQIEGKIYVIGSFQSSNSDRLEIYNITDDSWDTGTSLPTERSRSAVAELDDRIYVIGGSGDSTRLDRYDPDSDAWATLQSSENSHVGATAASYRGKLYVVGGIGSNGRIIEEYDPDSNEWTLLRNSPSRRYDAASGVINGRMYVIGGGEDEAEDRITAYDIEEDEWITGLTPMPKRLRGCRAVVLNGKIYVVGGEDQTGAESDAVYSYDPGSDRWQTMKNLPSPRNGAAVSGISSRLYVIGGEDGGGSTTNINFRGSL